MRGSSYRSWAYDTHRKVIFQVTDTYYRLLNAVGQVDAAEASLLNAKTVQEAAEETTLRRVLRRSDYAQAAPGQAATDILHVPELDAGFRFLYQLKFVEARAQFEIWQKSHPEAALGYASEAASYLFEECYRQGTLTSEFFLDDKRFLGNVPLKPDPQLQAAFLDAVKRVQDVAQLRLKMNQDNPNALFAMSMSLGMQANYASIIDKRQLDSLKKSAQRISTRRSC